MDSDPQRFSITDDLGDLLKALEAEDRVIFEIVNLNDFLPTLSGAAPTLRSRKGKNSLLDPESLTRASINKGLNRIRKSQVHTEKIKEKDLLKAKVNELESTIERQTKQLAQLEKRKMDLESQLSDQRTRSRLGSRPKISVEALPKEPSSQTDDNSNADYWKEQYDAMDRKYQYLREALSKKGAILRVSAGKSRAIPPPKGAPQPTFEPNDNDDIF